MRDQQNNIAFGSLLVPAVVSADSTPLAVDLRGFEAATVGIYVGVGGITFTSTNRVDFVLRHGDTDDVSAHTAVLARHLVGEPTISNGIIRSLTAAHAAAALYKHGYVGGRRYISLLADFGGTHGAGTPMAAFALLGAPVHAPVA